MTTPTRPPIRVLVVDDEAEVREAYRQVLQGTSEHPDDAQLRILGSRIFADANRRDAGRKPHSSVSFDPTFCDGAEGAVEAVRAALAEDRPYSVVFMDMRMLPGRDGIWAAAQIRELDPAAEIAIVTAYSDVDPVDFGGLVPPEDKLSYLQKPFHPHEVRQMAVALASKWLAERRVIRLAYFDSLTGLPNREQAHRRLFSVLESAAAQERTVAVLYIDLDNFKRINDTLGHGVGDEVLTVAAERLRNCLRYSDDWAQGAGAASHHGDIARLGGDEFVVVLPSIRTPADAAVVAERIIIALKAPMALAQHTVVVSSSIGISLSPRDGTNAEQLLRNADLAMYFSKRKAPGTFEHFDPSMTTSALKRYTIEGELRSAVERKELSLHYQPQFDIGTGTISGVEALVRWTNAELGVVSPDEFIPIAEETGLIIPIGEWVLEAACTQAEAWRREGLPVGKMAVNVSAHQFALPEFSAHVAAVLTRTGLAANLLELEITESTVTRDEAWAAQALAKLQAIGVSIAIDDFGTGYSNFGRLHHLPVDRLKMDRAFVRYLGEHENDRAIAAAIISMARSLKLSVVAEGVESFAQLRVLQDQNCAQAQGFLLSEPLTAGAARDLLQKAAEDFEGSRTQKIKRLIV